MTERIIGSAIKGQPLHLVQIMISLKLSGHSVGLRINFNIRRVVNNYQEKG